MGLVAAVQWYADLDFNEVLAREMARARYVVDQFKNVQGVTPEIIFPDETDLPVPRVRLMLDEEGLGVKAPDISSVLRQGDPAIYLRREYEALGILTVDAQVLREGEEKVVRRRLKEELAKGST